MGSGKRQSANVLLHPVRLAIVQQLEIGMRHMTIGEIAAELPEIASATLYRHVNALVAAGVCVEVGRHKVHSVQERVFAIRSPESSLVRLDNLARDAASPGRFDAIAMFLASLGGDFEASKRSRGRRRARGPTYISTVAHLTDEDQEEIARIRAWIVALRSRPVPPDASLRLVAFMEFPFARPVSANPPATRARTRK
jgi:hypothetical protein